MQKPVHIRPGFDLGAMPWHGGSGARDDEYIIFNHLEFNVLTRDRGRPTAQACLHPAQMLMHGGATSVSVLCSQMRLFRASSSVRDVCGCDQNHDVSCRWPAAMTIELVHQDAALALSTSSPANSASHLHAKRYGRTQEIVGFEVMPCSVARTPGAPIRPVQCRPWPNDYNSPPQRIEAGADIVYTYNVYWQRYDAKLPSRWQLYLRMPGAAIGGADIAVALVMLAWLCLALHRAVRRTLRGGSSGAHAPGASASAEYDRLDAGPTASELQTWQQPRYLSLLVAQV